MKRLFIIISAFFIISSAFSQKIGIGVGGIYNLRTKSIGYDLRLHWQVTTRLAIVPLYNRFPAFNKVFEQYYGLDVDYTIILANPDIYVLANLAQNDWFNYRDFHNIYAQPSALTGEIGIGARFAKKCIRPYLEFRYNSFWQEFNLRAGVIFFFGKCNGGGRGRGMRRRGGGRKVTCPAYLD